MKNLGRGLVGCMGLALVASFLLTIVFAVPVFVDGHHWIERWNALPLFLGSVTCGLGSFVLSIVGLVLALQKTPLGPDGLPIPEKPLPWQFPLGLASIGLLGLTLLPMLMTVFYVKESFEHSAFAEESRASGAPAAETGAQMWELRASDDRASSAQACCCSVAMLLVGGAGLGGTRRLARRYADARRGP